MAALQILLPIRSLSPENVCHPEFKKFGMIEKIFSLIASAITSNARSIPE